MNPDLKKYIEEQLAAGESESIIRTNLSQAGWPAELVEEVFSGFASVTTPVKTIPTPPPVLEAINDQVTTNSTTAGVAVVADNSRKIVLFIGLVVAVLILCGLALAYTLKLPPFGGSAPFAKDTIASDIAKSLATMETFTYTMGATFEVEARDADAKAFVAPDSAEAKVYREKYDRDNKRMKAISEILYRLSLATTTVRTLDELTLVSEVNYYSFNQTFDSTDPLTKQAYGYVPTGGDFRLTVTFETMDAINAITKNYSYKPEKTIVDADRLTVIFTKDSPRYVYLASEAPKSYFEQLNEMASYLPPELFFQADITAASDLSKTDPDWQVALDIEGDFGDLIYRIGGDVINNGSDYYYRIRNIPSIYSYFISYEKGTWIRVAEKWLQENSNQGMFSIPELIVPGNEAEDGYVRTKDELQAFLVAVVNIADEEGVLLVKGEPVQEKVNDRKLYRYDLSFKKDGLLPFAKRVIAETEKYEVTRESDLAHDPMLLTYLESAAFDEVFEYYINNTSLTMWVSEAGFIELIEYSVRVVPDAEAVQLAQKQARLTMKIGFENINEPIKIEAPADYKNIEDVPSLFGGDDTSMYMADDVEQSETDSIKSTLIGLRSNAEIVYNTNNYSYASVCTDTVISPILESMRSKLADTGITADISCLAGDDWYVIQAPLQDGDDTFYDFWCVDSTGYSGGDITPIAATAVTCLDN